MKLCRRVATAYDFQIMAWSNYSYRADLIADLDPHYWYAGWLSPLARAVAWREAYMFDTPFDGQSCW